MKVAPRQTTSFLNAIPATIRAILLHGSDVGQISERASLIAKKYSTDLDDVFSVTRIDGETLSNEPSAIADAAVEIALLGDVRLVLVKGRGAELLESCKLALKSDLSGSFIVVEARDTTSRHAIVKLFESADNAASIGCYADGDADIGQLARDIMARDNISMDQDALAIIIRRLGSDRAGSRMEIEKLALMAGPNGKLTGADVSVALGDSGVLVISDVASAAADGQIDALNAALKKAWSEDSNAVMILRGCQTHFRQLMLAGAGIAKGKSNSQAIKDLRPPVFFKMQDVLARQLRYWPAKMALDAVNRLQDCELQVKSGAVDDKTITAQCMLGLCLRAKALKG
jgi:DNA polymerase-3 subunit delta